MGKRELLLIGGFVVLGALVYHSTAPAAAPGQQGFSVSRILDHVRREIRGNRASANLTSTTSLPLRPGTTEIRFETAGAPLTITGEDRADVQCDLQVWSSGFEEADAKKYASETVVKTTEAGVSLVLAISYPDEATQRASLTVRMPRRLAVRVQPSRGRLDISNVASVELVEARGQARVSTVERLVAAHRGGQLTVDNVAALKLNSRGSTIALKHITGEATMTLQAGELRGQSLMGPIEVESNGTRITFEDVSTARRPLRINAVGGSVSLKGVGVETRIDGRDTRIDVSLDKPAPVSIYNEAEEPTTLRLPSSGGYQIDALATDGQLRVPDEILEVTSSAHEQRAAGTVGAGGPTITLRSKRGDITVIRDNLKSER